MGKRVAIAEEFRFGGTCVIRGCVPKKLYVYASQFPEHFEDAEGFGWSVGERSFSWERLVAAKEKEITRSKASTARGWRMQVQRSSRAVPNSWMPIRSGFLPMAAPSRPSGS